jgi:hypothetical protein
VAVSGSKDFELDVADYVEEAFERCGLELRTGYDLKSATRSLNLMLAEWANRGLNQWTVNQKTITMVKDTTEYTIDSTNPTATIDVLDVFVRETLGGQVTDIPLSRMSRAEYAHVSTKSTTGKPNQFLIQKKLSPSITIWPAPDKNSAYVLHLNVLSRMDDADVGANTLEVPFRFLPVPSGWIGVLHGLEASAGEGANAESDVRRRVCPCAVARRSACQLQSRA